MIVMMNNDGGDKDDNESRPIIGNYVRFTINSIVMRMLMAMTLVVVKMMMRSTILKMMLMIMMLVMA